jgi:hypothetical protein
VSRPPTLRERLELLAYPRGAATVTAGELVRLLADVDPATPLRVSVDHTADDSWNVTGSGGEYEVDVLGVDVSRHELVIRAREW